MWCVGSIVSLRRVGLRGWARTRSAFASARCARHGAHHCCSVPMMPRGINSVTSTNSAPSMNSQ